MLARFHHSSCTKATVLIGRLIDLGGRAIAFSAKLDDLVLKPTSETQENEN
jgi:hypothetical protein